MWWRRQRVRVRKWTTRTTTKDCQPVKVWCLSSEAEVVEWEINILGKKGGRRQQQDQKINHTQHTAWMKGNGWWSSVWREFCFTRADDMKRHQRFPLSFSDCVVESSAATLVGQLWCDSDVTVMTAVLLPMPLLCVYTSLSHASLSSLHSLPYSRRWWMII